MPRLANSCCSPRAPLAIFPSRWICTAFRVMMRSLVFLVLLGAWHIVVAQSTPYPPLASPESSPTLLLGATGAFESPPASESLTTLLLSATTSTSPSGYPIITYPFVPFPSPSSEPPIPGAYPLASPSTPPPVESPALVPDFAPAWASAYEKAKAKVRDLTFTYVLP